MPTNIGNVCYNSISRRASVSSRLRAVGFSHSLLTDLRMADSEVFVLEVYTTGWQPQRRKETSNHSILNIIIMKRLESFSLGGHFLTFPPCDNHVWTTEGLPMNRTDNSSLKRESLHQYRSLFTSPVKRWVEHPPADVNIIIAGIVNLSTTPARHLYRTRRNRSRRFSRIGGGMTLRPLDWSAKRRVFVGNL